LMVMLRSPSSGSSPYAVASATLYGRLRLSDASLVRNAISTPARNIACVALTKSLANTLGPFGINVNAIYPGTTITEAVLERHREQAERQGKTLDVFLKELRERSVIRYLVAAEDVANVVAFLCSPLAISITGEAISVSGGASADMHY